MRFATSLVSTPASSTKAARVLPLPLMNAPAAPEAALFEGDEKPTFCDLDRLCLVAETIRRSTLRVRLEPPKE